MSLILKLSSFDLYYCRPSLLYPSGALWTLYHEKFLKQKLLHIIYYLFQ